MPQFDLATFPTQMIWLAITFAVLYFLMARVALPRVGQVLEDRQKRIDDNLDKAESLKSEADGDAAAYGEKLKDAREQARLAIYESSQAASTESARRHAELGERLAGEIKEAEARIEDAKNAAIAEIGEAAAGVAREAVTHLIGITPSEADASMAIDAAIKGDGS